MCLVLVGTEPSWRSASGENPPDQQDHCLLPAELGDPAEFFETSMRAALTGWAAG